MHLCELVCHYVFSFACLGAEKIYQKDIANNSGLTLEGLATQMTEHFNHLDTRITELNARMDLGLAKNDDEYREPQRSEHGV